MIIKTNINALNAHGNLKKADTKRSKTSARLSSGHRINTAADDAAGLAISEKMRSQIRGLDMASKNAQDGISMLQIAEGALQEVNEMLHRIRELVVQAANDTNTPNDRILIAEEVVQLKAEIDALSDRTEYNGMKIFSEGEFKTLTYEITVSYPAVDYQAEVPDKPILATAADAHPAYTEPGYTIPGYTIPGYTIPPKFVPPVPAQLEHVSGSLVRMTDYKPGYWTEAIVVPPKDYPPKDYPPVHHPEVKVGDVIGIIKGSPEIQARAAYEQTYTGTYVDLVETKIWLQLGANAGEGFSFNIGGLNCYTLGLEELHPIDVPLFDFPITSGEGWLPSLHLHDTQGGWDDALDIMDESLKRVSDMRTRLGSIQNRLEYTLKSVELTSDNISAAESLIRNADMAKEMMELTKTNVLQEAATAMLAQANQAPQAVIQLLR